MKCTEVLGKKICAEGYMLIVEGNRWKCEEDVEDLIKDLTPEVLIFLDMLCSPS